MITIYEINNYVTEAVTIPWRSGTVPLRFVKFSLKGDRFYGFVVNNLKQYLSFIPSFIIAVPDKNFFVSSKKGDSDNAYLIPAIIVNAIGFSFTDIGKGKCELQFHLFSSDKQDWRQLDLFYRFFEREIRLINIESIKELEGKSFSVTIKKKFYNTQTAILGNVKTGIAPFRTKKVDEELLQVLKKDPLKLLDLFPARITSI